MQRVYRLRSYLSDLGQGLSDKQKWPLAYIMHWQCLLALLIANNLHFTTKCSLRKRRRKKPPPPPPPHTHTHTAKPAVSRWSGLPPIPSIPQIARTDGVRVRKKCCEAREVNWVRKLAQFSYPKANARRDTNICAPSLPACKHHEAPLPAVHRALAYLHTLPLLCVCVGKCVCVCVGW